MTTEQAFALAIQRHQAGQVKDAEALYRQIVAAQPNHAEAWHHLGILAHQHAKHDLGIEWIRHSLALAPNNATAHSNLGAALAQAGRHNEAIAAYRAAIHLKPDYAEARYNLGLALRQEGQWDEAIECFREALELEPRYPECLLDLGGALFERNQFDEAIAVYRRAIEIEPGYAEAYSNLGTALRYRVHTAEAIIACRRAVELKPDYPEAHLNLGNALKDKMRLSEAADSFQRALALNPRLIGARTGLALTEWLMGNDREAEAGLREVIAREADSARAHVNLGYLLLQLGRYEEGWREHEWRSHLAEELRARRPFEVPQWDGKPAPGQTLLLYAEQGYGDTIQFIRYAPLAAQRVGRLIVECQPALRSLLAGIEGISQVIERGEPLPTFDLHLPLMSLPHAFGTRLETIPAPVGFLRTDAEKTAQWKTRIERQKTSARAGNHSRNRPLKVGLVWAGGAPPYHPGSHIIDRRRSLHLSQLSSLAKVPGVVFVSLQKGPPAVQAQNPPEGMTLLDWTEELHDFADTAALVEALDLVIGVDTAVVHLAGSLGKPVWVLNRFDSCWRWLLDREDSPWYPTVRLFRQPAPGDWDAVIENVALELGRQEVPLLIQ